MQSTIECLVQEKLLTRNDVTIENKETVLMLNFHNKNFIWIEYPDTGFFMNVDYTHSVILNTIKNKKNETKLFINFKNCYNSELTRNDIVFSSDCSYRIKIKGYGQINRYPIQFDPPGIIRIIIEKVEPLKENIDDACDNEHSLVKIGYLDVEHNEMEDEHVIEITSELMLNLNEILGNPSNDYPKIQL